MKVEDFVEVINSDFYTGVPDSLLKPLNNYLMSIFGLNPKHHIIAANEGNAVGLAAGYYLATKKIPVVYMQNSGLGNAINPIVSLLNEKVYGIPLIFVIGWRGEPNTRDEPQHSYQGEITLRQLEILNIKYFVVSSEMSKEEFSEIINVCRPILAEGKQIAFVIKKDALNGSTDIVYKNNNQLTREEAIKHILDNSQNDIIVSTTGKISRELFETREINKQSHNTDFLTVGSMGHSSSIALSIAFSHPKKKIICLDGDGAAIMHLGALGTIGYYQPNNFIHIILNNEAHESVGGLPTIASTINIREIAKACGYKKTYLVEKLELLNEIISDAKKSNELTMIEIKCKISSRKELGRPTTLPKEMMIGFMDYVNR